jgi:hypothetical protein
MTTNIRTAIAPHLWLIGKKELVDREFPRSCQSVPESDLRQRRTAARGRRQGTLVRHCALRSGKPLGDSHSGAQTEAYTKEPSPRPPG